MARRERESIDPLRPKINLDFQRAAKEITTRDIMPAHRLLENCRNAGMDMELLHIAVPLAGKRYMQLRRTETPRNYPYMVANGVAQLNLDRHSSTKTESVLAALFEQTIAYNPLEAAIIRADLTASLLKANKLTLERSDAIDEGLKIAERGVAPFSRVPRQYVNNPNIPPSVFLDAQEMALAMGTPRGPIIKLVGAMTLLFSMDKLKTNKINVPAREREEEDAILKLAEKLYKPLAKKLGLDMWAEAIRDKVYALRYPAQRAAIVRDVEKLMGAGFYERGPDIVQAGADLIKNIAERALNAGRHDNAPRIEVKVYGRVKTPASLEEKLESKRLKRDYNLQDVTDLVAFRVVIPGNDYLQSYKVQGALIEAFRFDPRHTEDFIAQDKGHNYGALHLVGRFHGNAQSRHGWVVPQMIKDVPALEIQIKTAAQDAVAEAGSANHEVYKEARQAGLSQRDVAARIQAMMPLMERSRAVREFLADLTNGQKPRSLDEPKAIFVVDGVGRPYRVPHGASIMDALFAFDPGLIYSRNVKLNGVQIALDLPSAKDVRVKNGQSIEPLGELDTSRPPDARWLRSGVMKSLAARAHVEASISIAGAQSRGPSAAKHPVRRRRAPALQPGEQG